MLSEADGLGDALADGLGDGDALLLGLGDADEVGAGDFDGEGLLDGLAVPAPVLHGAGLLGWSKSLPLVCGEYPADG